MSELEWCWSGMMCKWIKSPLDHSASRFLFQTFSICRTFFKKIVWRLEMKFLLRWEHDCIEGALSAAGSLFHSFFDLKWRTCNGCWRTGDQRWSTMKQQMVSFGERDDEWAKSWCANLWAHLLSPKRFSCLCTGSATDCLFFSWHGFPWATKTFYFIQTDCHCNFWSCIRT